MKSRKLDKVQLSANSEFQYPNESLINTEHESTYPLAPDAVVAVEEWVSAAEEVELEPTGSAARLAREMLAARCDVAGAAGLAGRHPVAEAWQQSMPQELRQGAELRTRRVRPRTVNDKKG